MSTRTPVSRLLAQDSAAERVTARVKPIAIAKAKRRSATKR